MDTKTVKSILSSKLFWLGLATATLPLLTYVQTVVATNQPLVGALLGCSIIGLRLLTTQPVTAAPKAVAADGAALAEKLKAMMAKKSGAPEELTRPAS